MGIKVNDGLSDNFHNRYELSFIKKAYKARSSSCTITELSKLLTSCLIAVKTQVRRCCEKVYERSSENLFRSIKKFGEV